MDSSSPPLGGAPRPKPPGFFRLFLSNLAQRKQGLGMMALATSCLFLSMSMLDHKHRFEQLQEHYLSLKKENEELRRTLGSVTETVYEVVGNNETPQTNTDPSPLPQKKGHGSFMV